jgi:hypothetical protein
MPDLILAEDGRDINVRTAVGEKEYPGERQIQRGSG